MNNEIMEEKHIWGIHTPEMNDDLFLQRNTLAIGWEKIGDLSNIEKPETHSEKNISQPTQTLRKAILPLIPGLYLDLPAKCKLVIM